MPQPASCRAPTRRPVRAPPRSAPQSPRSNKTSRLPHERDGLSGPDAAKECMRGERNKDEIHPTRRGAGSPRRHPYPASQQDVRVCLHEDSLGCPMLPSTRSSRKAREGSAGGSHSLRSRLLLPGGTPAPTIAAPPPPPPPPPHHRAQPPNTTHHNE